MEQLSQHSFILFFWRSSVIHQGRKAQNAEISSGTYPAELTSASRAATDENYAPAADRGAGGAREELRPGEVRPSPKEGCGLPLHLC
jgi:hypothetical protein